VSTYKLDAASFLKDVSRHEMTVIRDDGLSRHVRFKRPGTMCMHFDLLTWPGYLCYTGDMGTYVFRRLDDMFEFFRRGPFDRAFQIDRRYWAEKLEAADRCDGVKEFSIDVFKAEVRDFFEQATTDDEDWPSARCGELWEQIEADVLDRAEDEHAAWVSLRDFSWGGFRFEDWERDCKEYTHRFQWCCFALEWAIGVYDAEQPNQSLRAPMQTAGPDDKDSPPISAASPEGGRG
jgi:hypothetical protein